MGAAYGWSILAVGSVMIVAGNISIKYIIEQLGSNNSISSANILDAKSKSNTGENVLQQQQLSDEQPTSLSLVATSLHSKNTLQELFVNHLELLNSINFYPQTVTGTLDLIDVEDVKVEVMQGNIGNNMPFILIPLRCTSSHELVANRKYPPYTQQYSKQRNLLRLKNRVLLC